MAAQCPSTELIANHSEAMHESGPEIETEDNNQNGQNAPSTVIEATEIYDFNHINNGGHVSNILCISYRNT